MKKGDTIQGRTLYKGGHYLRKYGSWEKRGDSIQGRTLYKGGHYSRKYGIYAAVLFL